MESSRKLTEIKSLHDKIRVSTEEAKKKEEVYKQLVTKLRSFDQNRNNQLLVLQNHTAANESQLGCMIYFLLHWIEHTQILIH